MGLIGVGASRSIPNEPACSLDNSFITETTCKSYKFRLFIILDIFYSVTFKSVGPSSTTCSGSFEARTTKLSSDGLNATMLAAIIGSKFKFIQLSKRTIPSTCNIIIIFTKGHIPNTQCIIQLLNLTYP